MQLFLRLVAEFFLSWFMIVGGLKIIKEIKFGYQYQISCNMDRQREREETAWGLKIAFYVLKQNKHDIDHFLFC